MRVMTQQWRDLVFLHWDYDPEVVRAAIQQSLRHHDLDPDSVELDTYNGRAYVGLIPFRMRNLRLRGLPPIPTTSNFPEINVRTYVRSRGRPAVWFFSLDTPQLLPTAVARTAFRLPYCYADAEVTSTVDQSDPEGGVVSATVRRRWPRGGSTRIAVRVGSRISASESDRDHELDEWLTARWGLVSASRRGRLWYGPVEHEPWPLHRAEVLQLNDSLIMAAGLPAPIGSPHAMYSPGVSTTIRSLERLR
ncbi:MAG: YqjF family protein [Ilumatobacteraceae bacterium]